MAVSMNNLFATFKTQLGADKKKTAILSVLFVVLIGLTVRAFMGEPAPEPVAAQPVAVVTPAKDKLPAADKRPPKGDPPKGGETKPAKPPVTDADARKISVSGFSRRLDRDIFSTRAWDRFPLDIALVPAAPKQRRDRKSWLERVAIQMAEEQRRKEEAISALKTELDGLELQSTLTGPVRSAHVSGRLLHEGDQIRGFSVLRIEDREIVLEKSDFKLSLRMP